MARVHHSRSATRNKITPRPRKEAQQDRSRALVESLLRATARILIRDGYAGLTTNAVAGLAGVSVGSLYQYFPNKDALVSALLNEHVDRLLSAFRDDTASLLAMPVERAIPHLVRTMLEMHCADPALHRVFAEQLPRLGGFRRIEASLVEGIALARMYLAAHAAEIVPTDLDTAAFVVVHTVEALTHAAVLMSRSTLDYDAIEREVSACLIRYLKG